MDCAAGRTDMADVSTIAAVATARRVSFAPEMTGACVIAVLGAAGFLLFSDDLAFLTRLVGIAFLVLSLDLLLRYCGVAALGHSALFGAPALALRTSRDAGGDS